MVIRAPFLPLSVMLAFLGACIAWYDGAFHLGHAFLAGFGILLAHISVDVLNEYFDYKSGIDLETVRTPFSGGSGTLPRNPEKAGSALTTGLISLGLTGLIGIYFLYVRGLWLLPLGALGIAVIVTYTPWITKSPLLCLIAPGLGFGTLMVMGTGFVLTGAYSGTSFTTSFVPFFLVSNLLLLNQFLIKSNLFLKPSCLSF